MEINQIYNEPCLETLSKMPDNFIDCVITSPPYWQLRDYGYDGQWGLEPTFYQYLENLWSMMDEIHRVLKKSGTCWINLGDTYGGGNSGQGGNTGKHTLTMFDNGVKKPLNKCLLLIPHRFAIGCINRGWIIRNDIIWAKRNAMPESVTDRFSKKHEYFFFMVKNENYFFDLDLIRDKQKTDHIVYSPKGKNPGDVSDFWDIQTKPNHETHYAQYSYDLIKKPILAGCPEGGLIYDPFLGSGSTAEAAIRANRNFIGSEMNPKYCEISNKRIKILLNQTKLF